MKIKDAPAGKSLEQDWVADLQSDSVKPGSIAEMITRFALEEVGKLPADYPKGCKEPEAA